LINLKKKNDLIEIILKINQKKINLINFDQEINIKIKTNFQRKEILQKKIKKKKEKTQVQKTMICQIG
jgi:hypothetical protein